MLIAFLSFGLLSFSFILIFNNIIIINNFFSNVSSAFRFAKINIQLTGADPYRFPPFYGNRSDFSL